MRRHGLVDPLPTLAEVTARTCGMHAQVMSAAEVALGVRTSGVTRQGVREALWERRELVKTFGPRGTVHLVAASDLPSWCSALAAAPWPSAGRPPGMRLSDGQLDLVVAAVDSALGAADRTIEELDAEVASRAGPWAAELVMPGFDGWWPRWRQAISLAAYRGVLCYGPDRGRRATYTHPRRWVRGLGGPETANGLSWLVLRYLGTYGPATAAEVAQWLGVPPAPMRRVLDAMAEQLVTVDVDGVQGFLPDDDADLPDDHVTGVRLLPYFDPYVVGCHPRSSLFPGTAAERALTRGQAGTRPVLLVDGTVAGVWHQRRSGRTVQLTVEPFGPLTAGQRAALDAEADRVAAVVDATPKLTIGSVTARSHL